jgi:hypothetical protein
MDTTEESNLQSSGSRFTRVLDDANKTRTATLKGAVELATAQVAAIQLEQLRLAFRYGDDSPTVLARAERLRAAKEVQAALQAELQRASASAPKPDPKAFTLYGRVVDSTQNGVAGATLTLAASTQKNDARAKTDDHGAFVLTLRPAENPMPFRVVIAVKGGKRLSFEDTFPLTAGTVLYREYKV